MTEDRTTALRRFFARYLAAESRLQDPRIEEAFATVPRERFLGPGPWSVNVPGNGYILTPTDDPAFLYQDTLVGIDPARGINIGQPSAHMAWLDALAVQEGETVLQVGAGTGYYTTILAHLVGPEGRVHAFEVDPGLAERAAANVAAMPWVTIHGRSGLGEGLPQADAVYVNAGASHPARAWLDAMRPGGRLLFPLHGEGAFGGMLLVRRPEAGARWPARFVSGAGFIGCVGGQDAKTGRRLTAAFRGGGRDRVQSLRLDAAADDTCWFAGDGWWLSTAE